MEVARRNVGDKVVFRRNITDEEKWNLIAECTAMIYTPENEHFGIVPLEVLTISYRSERLASDATQETYSRHSRAMGANCVRRERRRSQRR